MHYLCMILEKWHQLHLNRLNYLICSHNLDIVEILCINRFTLRRTYVNELRGNSEICNRNI